MPATSAARSTPPLDQIDASNFSELEVAWEWTSVDNVVSRTTPGGGEWWAPLDTIVAALVDETPDLYRASQSPSGSRLQSTPLMVGSVLYFNTPLSQGVAVDATTGKTLWVFNPKSYEDGTPTMSNPWSQRGVAYWTDGEDNERIFWGTGNGYLVCVDAKTGRPCPDFGVDGSGMVDAMVGIPRAVRGERDYLNALPWGIHSPPIVVRDKVIHGSHVADRRVTKEAIPGWVRAWDTRTGEHAWDFRTVPNSSDEYGVDTWLNDSWRYSGNGNVWSMLAGDNELGHVYLPTGTVTNDYYGADRLGDNLFSESIIAVDVETGQRLWHFQAVHHGLWDYDFPTHSNLVDITVDRREIKALAQGQQAGLRLRLRPCDRRPRLADRRAAGATGNQLAGGGAVGDAAVSDQAGTVRLSGGHDQRPGRFHPGDSRDGAQGGRRVPTRTALHTARSARRRGDSGHHHASTAVRHCRLVGCGRRSRHRHAVCALNQPASGRVALRT